MLRLVQVALQYQNQNLLAVVQTNHSPLTRCYFLLSNVAGSRLHDVLQLVMFAPHQEQKLLAIAQTHHGHLVNNYLVALQRKVHRAHGVLGCRRSLPVLPTNYPSPIAIFSQVCQTYVTSMMTRNCHVTCRPETE